CLVQGCCSASGARGFSKDRLYYNGISLLVMHICFLTYEYPLWGTGGIGSFVQTFGRALVRSGHKVTVLGIGKGHETEEMDDMGVEIIRLSAPRYLIRTASSPKAPYNIRIKLKEPHANHPIATLASQESLMSMLPCRTPYVKVVRMHGGHHFFAESQ